MAIQVGGTSVISNNRVLENVSGLKTINGTSILGSGDITAGGGLGGNFNIGNSTGGQNIAFRATNGAKGVPNSGTWICYAGFNNNSSRQMQIEVDGNTSKSRIEGAIILYSQDNYRSAMIFDDSAGYWRAVEQNHNIFYSANYGRRATHVAWLIRTNGAVNFKNNRNDNGATFGYEKIE